MSEIPIINAYYELNSRYFCIGEMFGVLSEKLALRHPGLVNIIDAIPYRQSRGRPSEKFGAATLIIENPETDKYFLISAMDYLRAIYEHPNYDLENCVEVFASLGLHEEIQFYKPNNIAHTPISVTCCTMTTERAVDKYYNDKTIKKHIPEKPTFRGALYSFRKFLNKDERFSVQGRRQTSVEEEHIKWLSEHKIGFGLCGGEISQNDVEVLGLGNALLRQKLKTTKTHNPLIPDFHYISVEWEDISTEIPIDKYFTEISNRIIDRYNEVSKMPDFLDFISKNGRKWYEENGTAEKAAEIIYNLLDLKKLK